MVVALAAEKQQVGALGSSAEDGHCTLLDVQAHLHAAMRGCMLCVTLWRSDQLGILKCIITDVYLLLSLCLSHSCGLRFADDSATSFS